jgi:hypothetical protein
MTKVLKIKFLLFRLGFQLLAIKSQNLKFDTFFCKSIVL